jgi:hypothetical protein
MLSQQAEGVDAGSDNHASRLDYKSEIDHEETKGNLEYAGTTRRCDPR